MVLPQTDFVARICNTTVTFVVHYKYILAPEAVTMLGYEQSYVRDSLIKITVKWMVSSQSKSLSCLS